MPIIKYSASAFGISVIIAVLLLIVLGFCVMIAKAKSPRPRFHKLGSITLIEFIGALDIYILSDGFKFDDLPSLLGGFLFYSLITIVVIYFLYILGCLILVGLDAIEDAHESKEDKSK